MDSINWLSEHAIPFDLSGPEATAETLQDPLRNIVGNARAVALGESSHGTLEFSLVKRQLISILVNTLNFDVVTFERGLPEMRIFDDAMEDRDLLDDLIRKRMYRDFYPWGTEEVRDMLLWMSDKVSVHNRRLRLGGWDMQSSETAIQIVEDFAFANNLERALSEVRQIQNALRSTTVTASVLEAAMGAARECQEALSRSFDPGSSEEYAWVLRIAVVITQAIENRLLNLNLRQDHVTPAFMKAYLHRERSMAENAEWILGAHPGSRIILWGHDGHLSKEPDAMGGFLHEALGNDYVSVGFKFYEGSYSAGSIREDGSLDLEPRPCTAAAPPEGSLEWYLGQLRSEAFLLDLGAGDLPDWLGQPLPARSVGAVVPPDEFANTFPPAASVFDGIVFVRRSSSSRPLEH